ncbi:hypothetical protein AVEN_102181-1 [Araneus ventricosus]|uniref:Uncharacterized protein n=1 Tax=Araneus ventricosus TaxID=182803 RepID=A0A4Y2SZ43_ARAVE|nr:hypothetical protein AVEN_102181-1 [Araneus ventricosus]
MFFGTRPVSMTKVGVFFFLWAVCSFLETDCVPQMPMMPEDMPPMPPRDGITFADVMRMFGLNFDFNAALNGAARLEDGNGGGPGFNLGFGGNGGVNFDG